MRSRRRRASSFTLKRSYFQPASTLAYFMQSLFFCCPSAIVNSRPFAPTRFGQRNLIFMPRNMVCYTALALLAAAAALPLPVIAAPQEVVPADSFIAQHVGTAAQLHQQISLDPVVRRRLARHFHTSAPAVTRYIQDNLVLTKLKKARALPSLLHQPHGTRVHDQLAPCRRNPGVCDALHRPACPKTRLRQPDGGFPAPGRELKWRPIIPRSLCLYLRLCPDR